MGGLACALALAKEGFTDIHVFEHAPDMGFVGAGIQMAPNMARILDRLGVWEPIVAEATKVKDISIRSAWRTTWYMIPVLPYVLTIEQEGLRTRN